jgi:hypothetical protein
VRLACKAGNTEIATTNPKQTAPVPIAAPAEPAAAPNQPPAETRTNTNQPPAESAHAAIPPRAALPTTRRNISRPVAPQLMRIANSLRLDATK